MSPLPANHRPEAVEWITGGALRMLEDADANHDIDQAILRDRDLSRLRAKAGWPTPGPGGRSPSRRRSSADGWTAGGSLLSNVMSS
jgi:hypothetical protein